MAEQCCRLALQVAPELPEGWYHLAIALRGQGRRDDACAALDKTDLLAHGNPDAQNNIGLQYAELGELGKAEACYLRSIRLAPSYALPHANLGILRATQGRIGEATEALRQAIQLDPTLAAAYSSLSSMLLVQGKLEEADGAGRRAVAMAPGLAEGWLNLSNVLFAQKNFGEAAEASMKAVELDARSAKAWSMLAGALKQLRRYAQAEEAARKAIAVEPDAAIGWGTLGELLVHMQKPDAAIEVLKRAIDLAPASSSARIDLANAFKDIGRVDEALGVLREVIDIDPANVGAHSNLVYYASFSPTLGERDIYEAAQNWGSRHGRADAELPLDATSRDPNRRLRIGYLSPDFCDHCQALFSIPLLSSHDHRQVEVFCYADVRLRDIYTDRIAGYADHWREITAFSDDVVVDLIRGDQIDVLVDLTMHMANGRQLVFAKRAAPVQIAWLAYPGTTGNPGMDYRLTDPWLDPTDAPDEGRYTERSVRLPSTFWCYDPLQGDRPVGPLPALAMGHVTFGCLNSYLKVSNATLALWARTMAAVDGSRLIMLAPEGSARERVLNAFAQDGIAADRIRFVGRQPRDNYLDTYHETDIALDTLPYNGHTTSLDAYWMGVPVVSLVGSTIVGRAGWSQLNNLGLPELAVWSESAFVERVAQLSGDLPRLAELRASLRGRMQGSALMNAPDFARAMEAAYRRCWQERCAADRVGRLAQISMDSVIR